MPPTSHDAIRENPKFKELVRSRSWAAWILTLLVIVIYFGFILLIAFDKAFLAQKLGSGVTTIGIPIGLGVIVSTFILTGIYVSIANSKFDRLSSELIDEVTK